MAQTSSKASLALPEFPTPPRLLIVTAPYVKDVTDRLVDGAVRMSEAAGAIHEEIDVPGALEISPAINLASKSGRFDGYVALGCIMRGETTHYDTVCSESARGLTLLGLSGLCIGNGILTVETMEQALVRADHLEQDKGGDAAAAAMHLVALSQRFGSSPGKVGFRLNDPAADEHAPGDEDRDR